MDCMDFHAVNACLLAERGGLGEGLNDLVDLLHGHFGALDVGRPAGRLGAGACQLMAGIDDGLDDGPGQLILVQGAHQFGDGPAAAHAGGKLDEQLGTGLVDLVHEDLQFFEHPGILPEPLAPDGIPDGSDAGDDQADIVVGPLQEELGCFLVKMTAAQLEPAEQGGIP